jgi:hypothetical protein
MKTKFILRILRVVGFDKYLHGLYAVANILYFPSEKKKKIFLKIFDRNFSQYILDDFFCLFSRKQVGSN